MIVVLQRVSSASVAVDGKPKAAIGAGFVALVGVRKGDDERSAEYLAHKVAGLRVFGDDGGRFNRDIVHPQVRGAILAVSQFTLLADCRRGRRPGFDAAETPRRAEALFEHFVAALRAANVPVETGSFGATMRVELVNEGPVTIILDTERLNTTAPKS